MATNTTNEPGDNAGSQAGHGLTGSAQSSQAAADLIRQKVARLYDEEPSAMQELDEAQDASRRSKHQQFMYDLGHSGKDLATIQTEWHDYYQNLPAEGKFQVWQEFYASQSLLTGQPQAGQAAAQKLASNKQQVARPKPRKPQGGRSSEAVRSAIRDKVTAGGKLEAKHHVQSLLFGLGMGVLVLIIFLFGFFNEVIIAPFIQPSRTATNTPLIVNGGGGTVSAANPEVIIPKINVEIPVIYSETSTNESVIENDLQGGVVHYPTTSLPGQVGNAAFFGHSSNNIFNKGKYKFAFVLLHTLIPGDTFYLSYNGKMYVYKVITRNIVDPSNVSVLSPVAGQTATVTLITCDPPGTSLHRLIVVGQQISPDPVGDSQATGASAASSTPTVLPGNGPTLWGRFASTNIGKAILVVIIAAGGLLIARWANRRIVRLSG